MKIVPDLTHAPADGPTTTSIKLTKINPESSDNSSPQKSDTPLDVRGRESAQKVNEKKKVKACQNMVYYDKCKLLTAPSAASVPIF